MYSFGRAISIAIFMITVPALAARAQDDAVQQPVAAGVQRLCVDADIVGHYYKMVDFRETPPRQESQWEQHFPYEYLTFSNNNRYSAIASNVEYKTPKELERFMRAGQDPASTYTLSQDGRLDLLYRDKIRFSYRCVIMLKPTGVYIPGDIVLNGYTRKAKSEIYRLYRRWY